VASWFRASYGIRSTASSRRVLKTHWLLTASHA
jgi:hypothetical protein